MNVLTSGDVDAFIERGFCVLKGAFTAQQAGAACERVWHRMHEKAGIDRNDPSTWPVSYDIEERLDEPEVVACFTDRLVAAIEQLAGPRRWQGRPGWGFWPVNFAHGAHRDYGVPAEGWHIDGNWFRHYLHSPQQGLLVIGLFTDIQPRGGGTVVAQGSHILTAQVLARHPDGLTHTELFDKVLAEPIGNFHELTGEAGDVVLGHPFLFHTRGIKHVGPPRFISNVEAGLREPMCFERCDGTSYSILERSIRAALAGPAPVFADPMRCRF